MATTKSNTKPATQVVEDPKAQLKALQAQAKALREDMRKAREARKGETVQERINTSLKYIAIFQDRATRLRAKAAKAESLVKFLQDRIAKDRAALATK